MTEQRATPARVALEANQLVLRFDVVDLVDEYNRQLHERAPKESDLIVYLHEALKEHSQSAMAKWLRSTLRNFHKQVTAKRHG